MSSKKPLNLYLDSEVVKALKIRAIQEGTTVSELVERLALVYLREEAPASEPGRA